MSGQPEGNFIRKVHKGLSPTAVYKEKMHNVYRGGTPDCYYEGSKGAFWIEYKWLVKLPKNLRLDLSSLQLRWLQRNAANGYDPWVVLGIKGGAIIFDDPKDWTAVHPTEIVTQRIISVEELCSYIEYRSAGLIEE